MVGARREYPAVMLDNINWNLRKSSERSWNFLIHSWDMMDTLLKAYEVSSDTKFLIVSADIAQLADLSGNDV